jgi:hypothetical protein
MAPSGHAALGLAYNASHDNREQLKYKGYSAEVNKDKVEAV